MSCKKKSKQHAEKDKNKKYEKKVVLLSPLVTLLRRQM